MKRTPSQISTCITRLPILLKDNDNSVIVSGIVPIYANLKSKADEVNNGLVLMCKERKIICLSESIDRVNSSMKANYI